MCLLFFLPYCIVPKGPVDADCVNASAHRQSSGKERLLVTVWLLVTAMTLSTVVDTDP